MSKIILIVLGAVIFIMNLNGVPSDPPTGKTEEHSSEKWQRMMATDPFTLQESTDKGEVLAVSYSPVGQTYSNSAIKEISISFAEPVAPLEKITKETHSLIELVPNLQGEGYWKSSTTYCYRLDEPPLLSTRYVVKFKGYTAFSGKKVAPKEWPFTTPAITLHFSNPSHDAKWQRRDQQMALQFSQVVDLHKIKKYIQITTPEGDISFSLRYSTTDADKRLFHDVSNTRSVNRCVIVTPHRLLPIASTIAVRLKPGLPAATGNIGMESERVIRFDTYNRFNVLDVTTDIVPNLEFFRVVFSNPVKYQHLVHKMIFSPAVYIDKSDLSRACEFRIFGLFQPTKTYTVTFPADLKDIFGNTLGTPKTYTLKVTDFPRHLHATQASFFLLENFLDTNIPVSVANVFQTPVLYKKMDIPDLRNLFQNGYLDLGRIDRKSCSTYLWNLPIKKNWQYTLGFDLFTIKLTAPGFYFMQFPESTLNNSDEYEYVPNTPNGHLFQSTDVALIAKYSKTQIFLAAFNLKTGQFEPDQTFNIENFNTHVDAQQGALGQVTSNQQGIAIFQPPAPLLERYKLEDCVVFSQPHPGFIWWQKEPMYGGWQADSYTPSPVATIDLLAFTEKYLYKEGQTVHYKGFVRQISQGPMTIPNVLRIAVKVLDSRGQVIHDGVFPPPVITPYGSFAGSFTLPTPAPPGQYNIQLVLQTEKGDLNHPIAFSVQEYKPANFEVKISTPQTSLVSGGPFWGTIQARYLFGTPMKQAQGSCRWTIKSTSYVPDGWPGYQFGAQQNNSQHIIHSENIKLDDRGEFHFSREALSITSAEKDSVYLILHGEIKDQDNLHLSQTHSLLVHRGAYYIGFKTESSFFKQGKPSPIQVVTVDPAGKPMPDTTLHLKITREEWKYVEVVDEMNPRQGTWQFKVVDVLQEKLTLPAGRFQREFTFTEPGYYHLQLVGKDTLHNTITTSGTFYVTGSGYIYWGDSASNTVEMVTDKAQYKPGENMEVLIKSPYKAATALVTLERENVLWSKTFRLEGNAQTLLVPVQAEYMPNVYLHVLLCKERTATDLDSFNTDAGKPQFCYGSKELGVNALKNSLNVQITPDKTVYEPGQEVKLKLRITDQNGAPVKSELCVAVVDKGVLNLVNYHLPNPFTFFWRPRSHRVRTVSTFNDLFERKKLDPKGQKLVSAGSRISVAMGLGVEGGVEGGVLGSGMDIQQDSSAQKAIAIRRIFKETVFYQDTIQTDEAGNGSVSFTLSDDLTTFKAMVTAITTGESFGLGSADLLVKKSIILKPALPYFLRPCDQFSAGVTVTNTTDSPLQVTLQVESKQTLRQKGAADKKTVTVNGGQTLPVLFGFELPDTATAEPVQLTFKARAGLSTDGLAAEIPVRIPTFTEAVANFGTVADIPVQEQLVVPHHTLHQLDNVEITLASSALVGVKRNFQILQEYPYDCLEQRLSKHYPLVVAGEFLVTYKLLHMAPQEIRTRIQQFLERIPLYQKESGGFVYYPEGIYPSEYLTCYALEFMLDAQEKGYPVNQSVLASAASFLLKQVLSTTLPSQYPYSLQVGYLVKSYAQYVLVRYGELSQQQIRELFANRDQLPLTAMAYLLKALDIRKDFPSYMQPVLAKLLLNEMKNDPTTSHFENPEDSSWCWVHESHIKTTAILLEAFLTVYGKFPYAPKIARWLATATNTSRGLSTQDHIRLFRAFEKYFQVYESETPEFVAQVLFNGVPTITESFNGRELTARTHQIALGAYKPGKTINTTFKKDGLGRLYYLLRMKYYPIGEVDALERGFKVEKIYKTLDNKPITNNIFKAGEKYIVEVWVTTPSERPFVILDDPVPAGLKVENPNFVVSSQLDLQKTTSNHHSTQYWGDFYRSEVYFDRVQVFADYLRAGTHVWRYLVMATNEGSYTVPNTVASEMYTPEVFGRSANRTIIITK